MDLTVKQTAELLDVSEKTIYRWLAADTIPHRRVGNQYRFARSELAAWAAERGREVDAGQMHKPDADSRVPSLYEAVQAGGIYYRLGGDTPASVLQEVTAIMRLPDHVDRENLYRGLTGREELASTGIGDGVAVPHMRFPLASLSRSQVALAFPATPVEWRAIDGLPVRIIFIPLCNTMQAHLQLLARLHFVLRQGDWRQVLESEAPRQEILDVLQAVEAEIDAAAPPA